MTNREREKMMVVRAPPTPAAELVCEVERFRRIGAPAAVVDAHARAAVAAGARRIDAHAVIPRGFTGFLARNEAPYIADVGRRQTIRMRWIVGAEAWIETIAPAPFAHGWVPTRSLRITFAPTLVALAPENRPHGT